MSKKSFSLCVFVLWVVVLCTSNLYAEGDLTKQNPIDVTVQLGSVDNSLGFYPSNLEFETGKLYKLILHNPSPQKHYFSSEKLAQSVFTRKVQVLNSDGNVIAEIKGTIREIEVLPGGTAEWWFVPVKTAQADDLECTIRGHADGGMVGNIIIR